MASEVGCSEEFVTDSDAQGDTLVSKKKTKAFVWKYFGFETDSNGRPRDVDMPKCRLCQAIVAAKDSNTSNLYSHLRSTHPEELLLVQRTSNKSYKQAKGQKTPSRDGQTSIIDSWSKQQPLSSSSKEHKALTNSVAYCLARDMLPLSTVDKPGFRAMIHHFNPRYQLPTRKHFTKVAIPALVNDVKCKIEEQIKSKQLEYFSATTELWTSAAGDPYITFTVHFNNGSWELKSYCLQTHYLPEDHTGTNIAEVLEETLQQWELDDKKLVGITTDSGSNVKLACTLRNWTRLSCFGHNLNLAVGKGLNDGRVQGGLGVCRSAVAAFSRSWKKQRDLVVAQEQKRLPVRKLKIDVVTRWGSTYDMVERMLEQVDAVRSVLSEDRTSAHLVPTWQDHDILHSIAAALKPLKCMTDALSGESCVTISAVKPLLNHLLEKVLVADDDDTDLTKEMKERIKVDLQLRYLESEFDHLLEVSSFLDPRFKLNYVNNRAKVLEDVEKEMSELIVCPLDDARSANDVVESGEPAETPPATKKAKGLSKVLGQCLGKSQSTSTVLTLRQQVKQELDQYLSHPLLDVEESALDWWKVEAVRYPTVAKLARKCLCLCATSVAAERVFSCGGNIVTDRRTCLKPEKVDSLVFLALNMKS